jgi:hypothetical protein
VNLPWRIPDDIFCVVNTKLTLRLEEGLVRQAKAEAKRRGKSVSQMVAEYFGSLGATTAPPPTASALPPVTSSLAGIAKGHALSVEDYRHHIRTKHE